MKTYKKLLPNPLCLGAGLIIKDEEFTDAKFSDINKAKLKDALRVNLVEEKSKSNK